MASLESEPRIGREATGDGRASARGMVALSTLAIMGVAYGALTVAYLSIRFSAELDPLAEAVSFYVYVDGARLHFTVLLLVLALAGGALTVGLVCAGVLRRISALLLMSSWCVGLVLAALFPTDHDPRIMSAPGVIHQVAGASLFVTLPLAALLALRHLAALPEWRSTVPAVRWSAIATLTFALSYLIARRPDIAPNWVGSSMLGDLAVGGLAQRALFTSELVLLLVLALRLRQVWRAGEASGQWR